jgi:hypothetical protein
MGVAFVPKKGRNRRGRDGASGGGGFGPAAFGHRGGFETSLPRRTTPACDPAEDRYADSKFTATLRKPSAPSMLWSIARVFSRARAMSPDPCWADVMILCSATT